MRNIKLTLEYDGTDFVGWQFQSNGRSVQEELEKALQQILQAVIRVVGAGRTDSGVHARGQVANFMTEKEIETGVLVKGLNALLPKDIAVLGGEEVPEGFHARYSARGRRYRYYIAQRPTAIWRRYCWELSYKLDMDLMNRCTKLIEGEHDFTSFCKAQSEVNHHRCIVETARWVQSESLLEFEITANRFLHGMVRALVGTMVDVGRGYRPIQDLPSIMDARDRKAAGMAAPSKGLFLEEIFYERS